MVTQKSNDRPKIVAAIPACNEEQFINEVVSKAKKYVDEVIIIDDGSTDSTAPVARAAGAVVVTHHNRQGYGESVKACFEAGRAHGADILVTLDGDAQHNPDEIQKVVTPILNEEADIVVGSRFLSGRGNMPGYRRFGIMVITFLFNFGSKVKVSDAQSGFRAYSKGVLNAISATEVGMSISVETLIKARAGGFGIKEVPVSCWYHPSSSSINPIMHGLGVALSVVRLRLRSTISRLVGRVNSA